MFLAVWILYAADRLLDARQQADLEERHRFHDRHRRVFVPVIGLAAFALAALTPQLAPAALRLYALLGGLLCGWFLLIHTRLAHERRLPKELVVGVFFAAAIFIPTVARRPDLRASLLLPAIVFAATCTLNCMYLYAWEHPGPRLGANWTTRFATRHVHRLTITLLAADLLCLPSRFSAVTFGWPIPAACAATGLILLILHRCRAQLSPTNLRAAADLTLLTPLLFVFFTR